MECPICNSHKVRTEIIEHHFNYGLGDNAVRLTCHLPLRVCEDCGGQFVDDAGETAREEAVRQHRINLTTAGKFQPKRSD